MYSLRSVGSTSINLLIDSTILHELSQQIKGGGKAEIWHARSTDPHGPQAWDDGMDGLAEHGMDGLAEHGDLRHVRRG
jgi:hypothetical protein